MEIFARSIPDAWYQCLYNLWDNCHYYKNQKGSFVGEERFEYDFIRVKINMAYRDPWEHMLPVIPSYMNLPAPVTIQYLHDYVPYIMSSQKKENEIYTYGERIWPQVPEIIRMLKATPKTNHAILQVSKRSDIYLDDPPCLRDIRIKIIDDKLVFYVSFRSWDLWAGFPCNLPALAILQCYIADALNIPIGGMDASSNGLHIYGYAESIAKIRTNFKKEEKKKE